ncbi:MAG TPA: O-antigen ligase family protein [Acidimicrobiales bacterium]|nr:O-antigen ligase family protein [Acidimicrobiales bacterium]
MARRGLLLLLAVAVPVVFDARTVDVFNVSKFAVLVVGAAALVGLLATDAVRHRPVFRRTGLEWPVLGLLALTALDTAFSRNPRLSLLGAYGSYDGLLAAVAFAVVFFAVAWSFGARQLRTVLTVLYVGAGGLVVAYGLLQVHDRTWPGSRWDWVHWGESASFAKGTAIWSTLGNPNHLGGFLAVMLPIGVGLLALWRDRRIRAVISAIAVAGLLALVQTTARGAWLATVAGLGVLGLLSLPAIRRKPAVVVAVAGALLVATLAAGVLLEPTRGIADKVASALDLSGDSSASQRVEFWKAAARMANDRPLAGIGPDVYGSIFPAYQGGKLATIYDGMSLNNGPHNVFMDKLAALGYPGLAVFVVLLAMATGLACRTYRRLRQLARHVETEVAAPPPEPEPLIALVAILAALVAYLVQASFDVQQIGVTFCFWFLLGLLCATARDTLAPGEMEQAGGPSEAAPKVRSRRVTPPLIAALGLVVVVAVAIVAVRPYRADLAFGSGLDRRAGAQSVREEFGTEPVDAAAAAARSIRGAARLNPWEPSYPAFLADDAARSAARLPPGSPEQLAELTAAGREYRRAARLAPSDALVLQAYAKVLVAVARNDPDLAHRRSAKAAAEAALRRAIRANPFNRHIADELRKVQRMAMDTLATVL